MTAPKLLIRKGIVNIQGKNRPCIQVQAVVDADMNAVLMEHFQNENLFKRSSYAQGLPEGVPMPAPSLASYLAAFVKNDACPEITVKTILAGQMQQCTTIWDVMVFEYIAKRAFDSLVDMMSAVSELQTETVYTAPAADLAAFEADTKVERVVASEPQRDAA
jgi:hypothetical protein